MTGYNYDAFSPDNYNLASADGPEVGEDDPEQREAGEQPELPPLGLEQDRANRLVTLVGEQPSH